MSARPDLVPVKQAAAELGFGAVALEKVARRECLLIVCGRRAKIDRNDYGRLIEGCRVKPQEQGSISTQHPGFSSSATPVAPNGQQALEAAAMLKNLSRPTSPRKEPSPAPVARIGSR